MKNLGMKSILAGLALCASLSTAQAALVFDDNATVFTDLTGLYRGVGTLTVNFNSASTTGVISFDLFGAGSVDGLNTSGGFYDDLFTVALNGMDVFAGYFNMSGGGTNSYTSTLGWTANTTPSGGTFDGGLTNVFGSLTGLNIGNNTFSVTFSSPGGAGDQGKGDESWALNDLNISTVPLPAGAPLLMAGLGALALLRRKRAAS